MRVRTQGSIGVSPAGATVIDKTDRIAYLSIELEDKWPYRHITINYEAAAEEARADYAELTFRGRNFYIQAC